jgi:DNA-directed RNA polymerase specialized sigma24 family protein
VQALTKPCRRTVLFWNFSSVDGPNTASFCSSTLRDRDLAEEIFQQLIIKILEWKSQLRSEDRAEGWIYRVLRNAVIDHHRRSFRGVLAMQEGDGERRSPLLNPRLRCVPALRSSW